MVLLGVRFSFPGDFDLKGMAVLMIGLHITCIQANSRTSIEWRQFTR